MVARIAPSPINTSVAIGDAQTHALNPNFTPQTRQFNQQPESGFQQQTAANNVLPPPSPPGEAFAAAIIAGQLPPRPITPQELRQRLGSAWQPPASPLRLMDKSA